MVGLSDAEVARRTGVYGPNELAEPPRRPAWKKFLDQFRNLLVYILLGAAVLSAAVGDFKDPVIILIVLLINAVLGYTPGATWSDELVWGTRLTGSKVAESLVRFPRPAPPEKPPVAPKK